MTTLRIIERQLMQGKPATAGFSSSDRESSLHVLQDYVDKETASAVQKATQPLLAEVERLARQITQLQASLLEAQHARTTERDRMQQEIQRGHANFDLAIQAQAQADKNRLAQTMRELETRYTQERENAVQALRAELDRECQARIQAEAKLTAMQETHTTFVQAMKAIKPPATQVVEVPVKGKQTNWAFEIRRRGDGLIDGVIAKPL